jgi:hypothetical protein
MTEATIAFVDQGRERYGPESIGTLPPIAPSTYGCASLAWAGWFSARRAL